MINVIAVIHIKKGTEETFLKAFRKLMPIVHAENGCLAYHPTKDVDFGSSSQILTPNSITIVEKWQSLEALAAHSAAPHMADFIADMKDVIEKLTLQVTEDL